MAAIHEALTSIAPIEWSSVRTDDLKSVLSDAFQHAQLLVDSIPIEDAPQTPSNSRSRSNTTTSLASSASEISLSSARGSPPGPDVEGLQKSWGKPIKMRQQENPLGISVYKLAGKDGKGAWFARRSVMQGLGFSKFKKGLEAEFPESMKIQGGPGEGNIRGIGGERRVEFQEVEGVGRMEVYHLSAQFPGPTTPRDFVTLLMTSDQALSDKSGGVEDGEIPRHFMVVSRPCLHPATPERAGFIRGQYQSIEFIREIPIKKQRRKSASMTNLLDMNYSRKRSDSMALGREAILRNAKQASHLSVNEQPGGHSNGRPRGKTISFDMSRDSGSKGEQMYKEIGNDDDDEDEINPVEWIMLTRSDPGGSVPRFMVERGTPGGIVADASKFLDWACARDMDERLDETTEELDKTTYSGEEPSTHIQKQALHDYDTNGHMVGVESSRSLETVETSMEHHNGIYNMLAAASATVASYTPEYISNRFARSQTEVSTEIEISPMVIRRYSTSSSSSSFSDNDSFTSAIEGEAPPPFLDQAPSSTQNGDSSSISSSVVRRATTVEEQKEMRKLDERKRKLDERLARDRLKELTKKVEDGSKDDAVALAIAKAEEKHRRDVEKHEDRYRKQVEKIEEKRAKEARKKEEREKKIREKNEKVKFARELNDVRAELETVRKEMAELKTLVTGLQGENRVLVEKVAALEVDGLASRQQPKEGNGHNVVLANKENLTVKS